LRDAGDAGGDGDEVGDGGGVFGPPGERDAAGFEVVDTDENDTGPAVVACGGHRRDADPVSACD